MKSRILIGSIMTVLGIRQFVTINKLQFQYPYVSDAKRFNEEINLAKYQFRKNSFIMSVKDLHLISKIFSFEVQQNDLVLCENAKGQHVFKLVLAVKGDYTPFAYGMSARTPPGFVVLFDPITRQLGMEPLAVIASKSHYSLGKWSSNDSRQQDQNKKKDDEPSLQRIILQRNNVRQLLRQSQIGIRQKYGDQS